MKKIITLAMSLVFVCLCVNGFADDLKKKIVGKWYSPYYYQNLGQKIGLHFKKDGSCEAINPTAELDLKSWKVENGVLIVEGLIKDSASGKWDVYKTVEKIQKVNSDSLVVVSKDSFLAKFIFLSPKGLKNIKPAVEKKK
mgnify:CR=1 FL=1